MPRGNGKSALAAALGLYGLLGDGVEGASVVVVAADERQARIVFNGQELATRRRSTRSARENAVYGESGAPSRSAGLVRVAR
jgi:phage terminase large subunit-like protein